MELVREWFGRGRGLWANNEQRVGDRLGGEVVVVAVQAGGNGYGAFANGFQLVALKNGYLLVVKAE